MISQKAKYAFKALLCLSEFPDGTSMRVEEIAEAAGIPRRFLEHILLDLKRKGIVASRRGRAGGYVLIKSPAELTIGTILRAIDGPIAPLPCISRTAYRRCDDCRDEATCGVRHLFAGTYAAMVDLMDGMTLAGARRDGAEAIAPAGRAAGEKAVQPAAAGTDKPQSARG